MNFRDLMSARQVARELEITVGAVNMLRARGTLPGHRVDLAWLYLKEDVLRVKNDPQYQKRKR